MSPIPQIPALEIPFSAVSPELLWFVFLAILGTFGVYSLFLIYHWFRYGMNILASLLATVIYLGVSGIILIIMLLSIAAFL
ncbi:hypothetical protein A3D62_01120 [Candidatus Kaiserbacteria bacterium RIFCSPHIGHO2_02_FULL_49_11]|uniref:Uncharacterized protein n=1 Tax=Candidatus Kaiserbacteria bacterium RIFCSPHIGHO2_02_FULL_49_11 TaxID=1798489 RepID=A0A1F6D0Y4_9BACT|nr:MAG: hypothetical protein A3D62_01120 [Candidatus Kaiserbacteria bacterium RIFCSPHIGHO2_02_FULL_49_11]